MLPNIIYKRIDKLNRKDHQPDSHSERGLLFTFVFMRKTVIKCVY